MDQNPKTISIFTNFDDSLILVHKFLRQRVHGVIPSRNKDQDGHSIPEEKSIGSAYSKKTDHSFFS